jgi:hypothetical protein
VQLDPEAPSETSTEHGELPTSIGGGENMETPASHVPVEKSPIDEDSVSGPVQSTDEPVVGDPSVSVPR